MNNNSKHMANLLFFEVLRLTFLYKVYDTSGKASDYAKETVIRPMNSGFSMRDTELKSLLLYFNDATSNPNLSKNDKIFLQRTTLDVGKVLTYCRKIMLLQPLGSQSHIVLKNMKQELNIDDPKLRAMLTLVLKWETLTGEEMRLLVERIKNYGLLHLRQSRLTKVVNSFTKDKSPYVKDENNNKLTPMDVMLGVMSGMAAKWSYDSRNNNNKSFEKLKSNTQASNYESPKK
mgnify:CR=1 FL=1